MHQAGASRSRCSCSRRWSCPARGRPQRRRGLPAVLRRRQRPRSRPARRPLLRPARPVARPARPPDHDHDAGAATASRPSYRAGFYFGDADVYTNKGIYSGELDVAPKAIFDADPSVAGCADGRARVRLVDAAEGTEGRLTVPVAVDRTASGLRLTVCLGAFNAAGLKIDEVYFVTSSVFRNPTRNGVYRFSAQRRPARRRRSPSAATQYEVRADEPLPEDVTVTSAAYDRDDPPPHGRRIGAADDKPRVGINVHVFAGQSLGRERHERGRGRGHGRRTAPTRSRGRS